MNTKKQRREAAQKNARKKRIAILAGISACVAAVIVVAVMLNAGRPDNNQRLIATGGANGGANGDAIIELTGPDFGPQVEEIQSFRDDFLGRTIRYEGWFLTSSWRGQSLYFVVRHEGGCCGTYGFEVYLNDIHPFADESWVEVTGVLEEFFVEQTGRYLLRLNVISLFEREAP